MNKLSPYRKARNAWKRWRFARSAMKPWTKGYIEYKQHEIERVLRAGNFDAEALTPGYGFRLDERVVEYPWVFSRLPIAPGRLLDAGSALNFDFLLELPALKSKKVHVCTLAPEADCFWDKGVAYLFEDLRQLPYRDGWFDWVVCLSTLEHIGMDNTLLYTQDSTNKEARPRDFLFAVQELRRVLKSGGTIYLSVPFGKAANHGWLQIFDSPMIEEIIATFRPAGHSTVCFLYHHDGWRSSNAQEAAGATFFDIHHAKGYDPDFAASARAVCCLELRK